MTDVDRLSLLEMARDALVDKIEADEGETLCRKCGGALTSPLPSLVRELRATLVEIDKMPGAGEVTELDVLTAGLDDELARRRQAHRVAGSPAS